MHPRTGSTLPSASTQEGWAELLANDSALAGGVRAIASRHGLSGHAASRYDSGSLPVYALDDRHVLKLYPPDEGEHAAVEARVLAFVQDRLPLPTPHLLAEGTQDGWHYVLMSRLRGRRLVDAWPEIALLERERLATALGESVAALHGLDIEPLAAMQGPRWDEFLARQRDSAVDRQRTRGLEQRWLDQIPDFLRRWMPPPAGRLSLLHTELMREHMLVERDEHGWRLSGLFDFEPAMVGDAEYDFASVGLFVSCGDARLLRRTLLAYGYPAAALDEALSSRLMAHALLHRYSNLRWYFERLPAPDATSLEQVARRWWAC